MGQLTFEEILQYKPDVCRSFGEPSHEVRIPVFSIRHIYPHVVAVFGELSLQVAPDAKEHLKLKRVFSNSLLLCVVDGGVDHFRIVCRDTVVSSARKQKLHKADVIFVNIPLVGKRKLRRFLICSLADSNTCWNFQDLLSVSVGASQV